jgi:threonine dehydrogenase-like Zn-dependent dehydrogenase
MQGVGIIVEVGPEVRNFKVGDRVTVSAVISCGKCEFCKRSEFSFCENTNPSKDMEKIYGHRTAGLFGYTSMLG